MPVRIFESDPKVLFLSLWGRMKQSISLRDFLGEKNGSVWFMGDCIGHTLQ